MSDAVQLLEEQHAEATALFMKLERLTDPVTCAQVFRTLDARLRDHSAIEEQVFYPAFNDRARSGKQAGEVGEALQEHAQVKRLLSQLETMQPGDAAFKSKLADLKRAVQHHVQEEEHEMLPQARRLFSQSELDDLGLRMIKHASLHSAVLEMAGSPP
jgi:hemerythrin superfamily protein